LAGKVSAGSLSQSSAMLGCTQRPARPERLSGGITIVNSTPRTGNTNITQSRMVLLALNKSLWEQMQQ